ncbi:hypothetical protein E2320_001499, partial [Naja naja]
GLKKTSTMLDEEFPRTALSINNRNELRNVLHLQSLYKQNKAKETPLKTILEIMACYFLELQSNQTFLGNSSFLENKSCHTRSLGSFPPKNFPSGEATSRQAAAERTKKGTPSHEISEGIICLSRRHCHKPGEKGKGRAMLDAQAEGEKKLCDLLDVMQIPGELSTETRITSREKPRVQPSFLPSQGRIAASVDASQEKTTIPRPLDDFLASRMEHPLDVCHNGSPNSATSRGVKKDDSTVRHAVSSGDDPLAKTVLERPVEEKKITSGYEKRRPLDIFQMKAATGNRSGVKSSQKNEAPFTDARSAPIDVEDEESWEDVGEDPEPLTLYACQVTTKPIDFILAKDLKTLLFGSGLGCFSEEWKIQSFTFSENPELKYGIVQKKGGPCGVLAAVQAHVLQHLIFGDSSRNNTVGTTGTQQFTPAGKYKPDGILEMLLLHFITTYEDLLMFLQHNVHQFEAGPHGCILLTLSVILSRSID